VSDHLNEEDLVLHYYGEEHIDRAAEVDAHLSTCPRCRAEWEDLQATLARVGDAGVAEPPATFEAHLWTRVRADLTTPRHARTTVVWGTLAATLAGVIAGGWIWTTFAPRTASVDARRAAEPASGARERVLLTALGDYLSQSEMLLIELLNAPPSDERDLSFERATADGLVTSGRLYRQTVRQTGETRLVDVLDDLEGVLVEVARSPDTLTRRDLQFLRERIEDDALLFRVRAATSDIEGRQMTLMYRNE
jgi:hypothetical protein